MDLEASRQLLSTFQQWHVLDERAKRLYQAQLAPDFRLMTFLQRNENALSTYLNLLLDPNGSHGQGDLYLAKFLAMLPDTDFASSDGLLGAYTEFRLPNQRRIDIYLQFKNGGLAIENKPWASDQKNQLLDYGRYLDSQHTGGNWRLIYLSNGEVNDYALPKDTPTALVDRIITLDFYQLTHWLEDCALYTQAPAVRLFVEALATFVREHINGEVLVENGQELTRLILRDDQNLKSAFQISQQLRSAKRQIWNEFEVYLREALLPSGIELVFEQTLIDGTPHSKIGLRFNPGDPCGLCWAFNKRNHQDLYFGISAWEHDDIDSLQREAIATQMSVFCAMPSLTPTDWWPWWTSDIRAFSAYPVHSNWDFEPDAWVALRDRSERGFAAQILNVANRFKLEFDLSLLHKKA